MAGWPRASEDRAFHVGYFEPPMIAILRIRACAISQIMRAATDRVSWTASGSSKRTPTSALKIPKCKRPGLLLTP